MSVLLETESLSLSYGRTRVLQDVDLKIGSGEFWFLVGPNGAGKTSLLKAFLGQLTASGGQLRRSAELQGFRRIGLVPQRSEWTFTIPTTVSEFVGLGTVGLSMSRSERAERVENAIERVGLAELMRHDYRTLSGGQRQRALIARALVRDPMLLFLDEPTTGLDVLVTERLMQFLQGLQRDGNLAMVFVTHRLSLALTHGTHFAFCGNGRLRSGSAREVFTPESLEEIYGPEIRLVRSPTGSLAVRTDGLRSKGAASPS